MSVNYASILFPDVPRSPHSTLHIPTPRSLTPAPPCRTSPAVSQFFDYTRTIFLKLNFI